MTRRAGDTAPRHSGYDVVLVGGAMFGAAVAWFLADNADFNGRVLVVERDPGYEHCSTAHTNSCLRQQFSQAINVRVSQFAADYIRHFRHYLGDDPRVPEVTLQSFGYLYLAASETAVRVLQENQRLQATCGAGTQMLTPDDIRQAYPFYFLDDILAGSHNRIDEGWFDGTTLFEWWRRLAAERGVEFISNTVVGLQRNAAGTQVESVRLKTGERVRCATVVNTSGPRALLTARMAGIELPVEPRKRYSFVFSAAQPLDRDLPLTIDPSGVHVRSDGANYLAGCPPDDDGPVDYDDFGFDCSLWENKVWPALAHRIPQFEALRLRTAWVGHYAFNTVDQNAILGYHSEVRNFVLVNGFSGHGLQQAPAIGRGIAELITYGDYRSLDLSAFDYRRIVENRPLVEKAVI